MTNVTDSNQTENPQLLNIEMPDVPAHLPTATTPEKIYLKDYKPPVFSVNHIDLKIELHQDNAKVTATLDMTRQTAGELVLFGRELQLEQVSLNGKVLTENDYTLDSESLTIKNAPTNIGDNCKIQTIVTIVPQTNTSLEGLYQAGEGIDKMFVTQCEPEGFRKITFYPDRPDVLATFTTRIEADKKYPTLLANGNLVEKGDLSNNGDSERHFAVWQDPTKKPSYLFACVMADLDVLTDHYMTSEGRDVLLEVYAKPENIEQCHVGMQALKDSMQWDEEHYGRAYDLDRYMIVAVSQFNMGAMENKGLNIFNTACVLSSPETTTDRRNFNVKAVIAHEYFHNWTGNRITCRDWFQLCLKEGFTVFRDQSFSESLHSPAVQRIDDVATLRAAQFPEDASPLAHPPRPDHFVEINNFYTATVYEKGAEIVRMIANTLGKEKFRQGTDEYFRRYDGQAVTVEDLLSALSVSGTNVENFLDWYTQPATPVLSGSFDKNGETLTISLSQTTRQVANYPAPKALPIPVKMAIFNRENGELMLEDLLLLDKASQDFTFNNLFAKADFEPVISLLRDFSAPVQLNFDYDNADLAFLMQYETNGFNRWQAAQLLVNRILLQQHDADQYLTALAQSLPQLAQTDPMLAARLLDMPAERELGSAVSHNYDPIMIKQKRDEFKQAIANHLADFWQTAYSKLPISDYQDTAEAMGVRAWRNVVLDFALTANITEAKEWATSQYQNATCMTERLGALSAVVEHDLPNKAELLADFYQRFSHDDLVMDLWFGVQAGDSHATVDDIFALTKHGDFDINTPNRVRSVLGGLLAQPTKLWTEKGLTEYLAMMEDLDKRNPLMASRLLQGLSNWQALVDEKKAMAQALLTDSQSRMTSKNVKETLQNMLHNL